MTIAYVNAGTDFTGSGLTSVNVPLPASMASGNLLLAVVKTGNDMSPHSWPPGWVVLDNISINYHTKSVAYRVVDGTESSPTVSWSTGNASALAVCFQYSGALSDEPIGDYTAKYNATTPHASDEIISIGINSAVIYIDNSDNLGTFVVPSGWTESYSNSSIGVNTGMKQLAGGVGTHSGNISTTGPSGQSSMMQIELVQLLPVPIDADATSTSASSTSTLGVLGIPAFVSSSGIGSSSSSFTFALGAFVTSSGVVSGSISVTREKRAEALSEGELQDSLIVGFTANADAISTGIDASHVAVTRFTAAVVNTGITISGAASVNRAYYEIGSSNATIGGTIEALRTINVSVVANALLASGAVGNASYNLLAESLAQMISGIVYVNDYMDGWAYNLNNQAPSFYENFKFNSFAKIGNQYYGLNNEGLHLLGANDDNGAEINALITTGISDFGDLRTKKIPVIYAGARTEKPLTLTCSVDNNPDYSYEFISSSEGIAPTRVKLGKGLEGRYWKLEIANRDGGDFEISDLDIPITLNSRGV